MNRYIGTAEVGAEQRLVPVETAVPAVLTGTFAAALHRSGILIRSPSGGPDGDGPVFKAIITALNRVIDVICAADNAETMQFPPAMARADFERTGFFRNFPKLAGTMHCFCGNEVEHRQLVDLQSRGKDWTGSQQSTDLVLTPAACYPVYPALADRGTVPEGGWLVDVASYCFRREPSADPTRLQLFRMREHVRVGGEEQVGMFREQWIRRGQVFASTLGLPHEVNLANDPFFGRAAVVMGRIQTEHQAKFELQIPIGDEQRLTACMSFNLHGSHFATAYGLVRTDGPATTGCIGFGMERFALALLHHHGLVPAAWPQSVRAALGLS